MRIQAVRYALMLLASVFLLQGCASFGSKDLTEYGRLVIVADASITGGGSQPLWDYKLWAKHRDTEKLEIIPVTVKNNMVMAVSLPMPAGEYDIVHWRWDTDDYSLDLPAQPKLEGEFEIFPQTATVLDKSLKITIHSDTQESEFIQQQTAFTAEEFAALVARNKKLQGLEFYWTRTKDFVWTHKVLF
ncbi:hypothetical protein [Reinekea marinisedimentorum]|uniref:DUF2330 domain-containing protein n=1 Tax=Reinekea marinisedimentorum TaxID=230495 RepID=A0A4R3I833_9GAMM|nr:hypothetical protein [Reinekea marinisedimentorum]TCS40327.1 hypothetical protein BCF53_10936 [Reinekea marinisedimentorum]